MVRPPARHRGSCGFRLARQIRLHPSLLTDPAQQRLLIDRAALVIHSHQAVNQVEAQPHHAGRTFQGGAQGLNFIRAIKPLHAQRAPR